MRGKSYHNPRGSYPVEALAIDSRMKVSLTAEDTRHLVLKEGSEQTVLNKPASGPHEDLLTTVKRRKLQWYGHVSCSSGLAKTISQGTVIGGRRQGRQRKRWEDNIRE